MNTIPINSVKALQRCTNKKEVENFFKNKQIDTVQEKSLYLKEAMGEKESYYSGRHKLSDEDLFKDDMYLFLRGTWRLVT